MLGRWTQPQRSGSQAELAATDEELATKDEELATKEVANAELARKIAELQALIDLQATGSAQQAGLLRQVLFYFLK